MAAPAYFFKSDIPTELTKTTDWNEVRVQYNLPSTFSAKARNDKIIFEDYAKDQYSSQARMQSFSTSPERLAFWIRALEIRYIEQVAALPNYDVKWTDCRDDAAKRADELTISVSVSEKGELKKLYTIKIHMGTGTITCQGNYINQFNQFEFPRLKACIEQWSDMEDTEVTMMKSRTLTLTSPRPTAAINTPDKATTPASIRQSLHNKAGSSVAKLEQQFDDIKLSMQQLEMAMSTISVEMSNFSRNIQDKMDGTHTVLKSLVAECKDDYSQKIDSLQESFGANINCLKIENLDLRSELDNVRKSNVKQQAALFSLTEQVNTINANMTRVDQAVKVTHDGCKDADDRIAHLEQLSAEHARIQTKSTESITARPPHIPAEIHSPGNDKHSTPQNAWKALDRPPPTHTSTGIASTNEGRKYTGRYDVLRDMDESAPQRRVHDSERPRKYISAAKSTS
jgi:hypothetical protein